MHNLRDLTSCKLTGTSKRSGNAPNALTVVPKVWTPFAAKFTLPKIGWAGVFDVAIAFDLTAAMLAFFVLRRMKVPVAREELAPALALEAETAAGDVKAAAAKAKGAGAGQR